MRTYAIVDHFTQIPINKHAYISAIDSKHAFSGFKRRWMGKEPGIPSPHELESMIEISYWDLIVIKDNIIPENFGKFYDNINIFKIFVDMDGVLTFFDKSVEKLGQGTTEELIERGQKFLWEVITRAGVSFWEDMEWMPDGRELWEYLKDKNVTILSSPSRSNYSKIGKEVWCKRNLGNVKLILSNKKELYANPKAILIDDRQKILDKWNELGGISILHKNTVETINKIERIIKNENVKIN